MTGIHVCIPCIQTCIPNTHCIMEGSAKVVTSNGSKEPRKIGHFREPFPLSGKHGFPVMLSVGLVFFVKQISDYVPPVAFHKCFMNNPMTKKIFKLFLLNSY